MLSVPLDAEMPQNSCRGKEGFGIICRKEDECRIPHAKDKADNNCHKVVMAFPFLWKLFAFAATHDENR
jgi:hypothetical protein